jgi:signal transduction histidine kinase
MKKLKLIYLIPLVFLLRIYSVSAQQISAADSVKLYEKLYLKTRSDSALARLYFSKSRYYRRLNNDSALIYGKRLLAFSQKNHKVGWEIGALGNIEYVLRERGELAEALNIQLQELDLARRSKTGTFEGEALNSIGNTYMDMGDARTGLKYYQASLEVLKNAVATHQPAGLYWELNENSNIGNAYEALHMPDSALFYELRMYHNKDFPVDLRPELVGRIGEANITLGRYREALNYYRKGVAPADSLKSNLDILLLNYQMAGAFDKLNMPDSGIYYAHKAFVEAKSTSIRSVALNSSRLLADLYSRRNNIDSAYHYQQIAARYNDTLFGAEKFSRIQHVLSDEQQRQQKLLREQERLKRRYQLIGSIAVVVFLLTIVLLVWRSNRVQRDQNKRLAVQKTQLTEQRDELQTLLGELKTTQSQLIQREKMASLGELTAGIAHEIQNPLNFVNNFSEVSVELLDELKEEARSGNAEEVIAIADDLTENLTKINHHGKRADGIVKGMLEHSRASTGQKEPTDINKLADEYLRLAYHGLRAKDKSFNAELVTHFDESLPPAKAIPQDMGRVMLNLFNNAFYAVHQKQQTSGADYKPTVEVSTSVQNGQVQINVKDNGIGIPENIKDKIMQPFFTTKPTGQGTGLGLSLSYDIVVKGHGGRIDVQSENGEFTEFILSLPLTEKS